MERRRGHNLATLTTHIEFRPESLNRVTDLDPVMSEDPMLPAARRFRGDGCWQSAELRLKRRKRSDARFTVRVDDNPLKANARWNADVRIRVGRPSLPDDFDVSGRGIRPILRNRMFSDRSAPVAKVATAHRTARCADRVVNQDDLESVARQPDSKISHRRVSHCDPP